VKHAHAENDPRREEHRPVESHGLRENERFYREIVEAAQEGIWVVNEREETTFVNQRLATMLGYTIEEMIGQPMSAFFVADAQSGEHGERRMRRKDGSSFWALLETRNILNRDGEYRGMRASVTDATMRHSVEAQLHDRESQLMQAQRTVGTLGHLAATAAYEFDMLLRAVQPYADVLERTASDPSVRAAAARIADAVSRGRKLVDELAAESQHIGGDADRQEPSDDPLARLHAEFDRELAVLRSPTAADELRAIFASTPEEMAKAANAATSKDK